MVWSGLLVNTRERSRDTSGDDRVARCHAGVVAAALLPLGGSVVEEIDCQRTRAQGDVCSTRELKYELIKDYKTLLPVLGRL